MFPAIMTASEIGSTLSHVQKSALGIGCQTRSWEQMGPRRDSMTRMLYNMISCLLESHSLSCSLCRPRVTMFGLPRQLGVDRPQLRFTAESSTVTGRKARAKWWLFAVNAIGLSLRDIDCFHSFLAYVLDDHQARLRRQSSGNSLARVDMQ